MKKIGIYIGCICLILDQFLKIFIKTHCNLYEKIKICKYVDFFFVENPGMAYGINMINGYKGKIILSLIRFIFIITIITYYIVNIKKIKLFNKFCLELLIFGSISNFIDNSIYGIMFKKGTVYYKNRWVGYNGVSSLEFNKKGYAFFLGGCVVDFISITYLNKIIFCFINFFSFHRQAERVAIVFNMADILIFYSCFLLIIYNIYFECRK